MGRKLKISPGELSQIYREFLKKDEKFNVYYEIARKNTSGNIWVIGSYLYGTLLNKIYDTPRDEDMDFDFLIETPFIKFEVPEGWTPGHTRFSDLKIERGNERIDFNSLTNIRSIIRKRIQNPTIKDFFEGTPFNIDSLAYNVESGILEGNKGLEALRTRILKINDYESLKESKPAEISIMDFLKGKARGLEFRLSVSSDYRSLIVVDDLVSPIYRKTPPPVAS